MRWRAVGLLPHCVPGDVLPPLLPTRLRVACRLRKKCDVEQEEHLCE